MCTFISIISISELCYECFESEEKLQGVCLHVYGYIGDIPSGLERLGVMREVFKVMIEASTWETAEGVF